MPSCAARKIGRAHVWTPVTQRSTLFPYTTLFRSHVNQCLGRDATDVQAGAAQGFRFDEHRLNAQLCCTDRRNVTARAAANNQQSSFEVLCHRAHSRNSMAGFSSRPRMAWMNAAASMPSTTRWSKDEEM